MKLVDIKFIPTVAQPYFSVPQPMTVYHSTEELDTALAGTPYEKVESFGQFFDVMRKYEIPLVYNPNNRYVNVCPFNMWIKTVDRFVPDYADKYGKIYYKTDDKGEFIPTDGAWIQVFFITPTPSRFVLFTSAGINTIGLTKWQPTGAVRVATFLQEAVPDKRQQSDAYADRLQKLMNRRKPDVKVIKFAMAMLSSDSESFLDIDKAAKIVYGTSIKKDDRLKLLESQAFREAFMAVIKTLFPTLAPAIRETHDPAKLATMLTTMWDVAENTKDIDKMLKVFDKIKEVGYEESTSIENNIPQLPMLGQAGTQPTAEMVSLPDPSKYTGLSLDEATAKALKALEEMKDDLDYPDSFIMLDEEGEVEDERN